MYLEIVRYTVTFCQCLRSKTPQLSNGFYYCDVELSGSIGINYGKVGPMLKVQSIVTKRTEASLRNGLNCLEAVDIHICVTLLQKAFPCQSWIQT
jgi:hypothetical protein